VYHVELRQFPHNLCRFNLDERELRELVEPWTREPSVEIEEQKWFPHKAKLTIFEGPQIPLDQLTMGRGWRIAERQGRNVTERVLAAARQAAAPAAPDSTAPDSTASASSQHAQSDPALVADSLGLELLALLSAGPAPLATAWRVAADRYSERLPSECLELAERAVRSLLQARLVVLTQVPAHDAGAQDRSTGDAAELPEAQVEQALGAPESWAEPREGTGVHMRRV
jgi:hypothetical protein